MEKELKLFNNIEEKPRITWIDFFKGIGIFLVVIGHSGIPDKLSWWIWSFHMPMFFFISGFLFNPRKNNIFFVFLKKRSKTLLRPYFSFTIIALIVLLLISAFSDVKTEVDKISDWVYVLLNGWKGLALWFLPVLFLTELVYFIVAKYLQKKQLLFIVLLAFSIIGFELGKSDIHLIYKAEVVLTSIFFYGLGSVFKQEINTFFSKWFKYCVFIFFILIIINIICCFKNSARLDMCFNNYGNYFLTYMSALSGIFAMIACSLYLTAKLKTGNYLIRVFEYLGKNTLIILGMHQLLKLLLNVVFTGIIKNTIITSIFKHVLFWVLLYILIQLFNKYLYFLLGKKKVSN